jgi:small multidrug resistance family-3 protein
VASPVALWAIFFLAAAFEVGGDALIRHGLRGGGWFFVVAGFLVLGSYGLFVNRVPLDFSRLLGAYVAAFAVLAVLAGRFLFKERIPTSTWLGLALIVVGGLVIQLGSRIR